MSGIIIAAVVVSCTGLLLGLFLGVMGKKFYVEVDQKEIDVRAELPGNNCGGCGYAGCDALLVPSRFEPCGLTQLIAMRYGAVPIVRETGGLKDTVQPYNMFENTGNGFTFDRYESGLLYDAINRAKTLYFENRVYWDDMVVRDMNKDVSWEQSAKQYKDMYVELTPR